MSVEFDGLEDIIEKFDKLVDVDVLKKNMQDACTEVVNEAKDNAPKDTGALRRSIQSKVESSNNEVVGIVFSPLEYAPYVEFGTGLFAEKGGRKDVPWAYKDDKSGELIFTKGQKPQPYLRPALHSNREKITEILKRGLTE